MPNFIPCDPHGDEPIFIPCKDYQGRLHALGDVLALKALCGTGVTELVQEEAPVEAVCDGCSAHVTNLAAAVDDGRLRPVKQWKMVTENPAGE